MALLGGGSIEVGDRTLLRCCVANYFGFAGEITFHSLEAVKTLRAARVALGAESVAFGRTLTFEYLPRH